MIYDVRCTQDVLVLREMSTIYDFIYDMFLQIRTYNVYTHNYVHYIYIIICARI